MTVLDYSHCPVCHTVLTNRHLDALARTIIGEARGEGMLDMLGVACVVRERALRPGWWGKDVEGVCKAPHQFMCWSDHNRRVVDAAEQSPKWPIALTVARLALYELTDRDVMQLFGVKSVDRIPTHYHDRTIDTPQSWLPCDEIEPPWESAFRWYVVRQGRPRRVG